MRLAQLDRAFGYGPKGRGFESSNARIKKNGYVYTRTHSFLFESFGFERVLVWNGEIFILYLSGREGHSFFLLL